MFSKFCTLIIFKKVDDTVESWQGMCQQNHRKYCTLAQNTALFSFLARVVLSKILS
jgi:hypothetical protein